MIFLSLVSNPHDRSHLVAPPGSAQRLFSTNPVTIGAPTSSALPYPLVIDIATSQAAVGKVRHRNEKGELIPEGWAINETGDPLTDPGRYMEDGAGALLPLGGETAGHKGFDLAFMTDLLGGMLSDGDVLNQADAEWGSHAVFICIDPTRFTTHSAIERRVERLAEHVRSAVYPSAVETGETTHGSGGLLPGEPEYVTAEMRREDGVPVPAPTARTLVELAEAAGVERIPDGLRAGDD
jgi:LDH2 family malate/lactate/ureidoglycolate dehydrogenase